MLLCKDIVLVKEDSPHITIRRIEIVHVTFGALAGVGVLSTRPKPRQVHRKCSCNFGVLVGVSVLATRPKTRQVHRKCSCNFGVLAGVGVLLTRPKPRQVHAEPRAANLCCR